MPVVLILLAALLFDRFVVPSAYVAAGPFALAMLVGARRYAPAWSVVAAVAAVALYLASAVVAHVPVSVWLANVVALAAIGYLGYLLAAQRQAGDSVRHNINNRHQQLVQFLGIVAHDMRQPLTAIAGYIQVLSRSDLQTETERRALEALDDSARRLRRLTEDLADASSVGTGRFVLRTEAVDLVELLRRVAEEHQALAPEHALTLDAPERLMGIWDPDRLNQLFDNLVGNAIKYSPQGGAVRIVVYHAENDVVVTVSDQGLGIPPQEQERLFEPFARLHTEAATGTGLGLFICRGIAEAHGGRISVESEAGDGSTFRVALPLVSGTPKANNRTRRPRRTEPPRVGRRVAREEVRPELDRQSATRAGEPAPERGRRSDEAATRAAAS